MTWKALVFSATERPQSITLKPGTYLFECWGAQGGSGRCEGNIQTTGGKGAYVSGLIKLIKRRTFYIYVGKKGKDGSSTYNSMALGGWSGGGNSGRDTDNDGSAGGGGASDIRLSGGEWSSLDSLVSRIIVAAGGSGSAYETNGAPGGALSSYKASSLTKYTTGTATTIGIGQNGINAGLVPTSGSGGGYFGGDRSTTTTEPYYRAVSSSGTSYVSGYPFCTSISQSGEKTQNYVHYSNIEFLNPNMLDGLHEFKNQNGQKETGHSGDGAVKITFITTIGFCSKNVICSRRNNIITYLMVILSV